MEVPLTPEEILRGIEAVSREQLNREVALRPEMDLIDDLELDSLQLLTLAVEVENRFRIILEEDDEAAIRTVGDLADVVARKLAATDSR